MRRLHLRYEDYAGSARTAPGRAFASACLVSALPGFEGVVGSVCSFAVQARDQFGNDTLLALEEEGFRVELGGQHPDSVQLAHVGGGCFHASYSRTAAGDFSVAVLLREQHIAGSPFKGPPGSE